MQEEDGGDEGDGKDDDDEGVTGGSAWVLGGRLIRILGDQSIIIVDQVV